MKPFFDSLFSTPRGVLAFALFVPLLISMFLMMLLKSKTARRAFAAVFVLLGIVSFLNLNQWDQENKARQAAQDLALRENSRVMRLAEDVANYWRDPLLEFGSAVVREPWLIVHVEYDRPDINLTDVMYSDSGTWLTPEALDGVQTICLWRTYPWEHAQYAPTGYGGGATITCSSQRAFCWIYDVQSAAIQEAYTLYSKPLPQKVSGELHLEVKPAQVRQSVLDRMAPSKETEKGD